MSLRTRTGVAADHERTVRTRAYKSTLVVAASEACGGTFSGVSDSTIPKYQTVAIVPKAWEEGQSKGQAGRKRRKSRTIEPFRMPSSRI